MAIAKQPVTINGIELDALLEESRELRASVPEYNVEDGYSVSDSIQLAEETLNMTVVVTQTPVTWKDRHSGSNHRDDVIQQLENMFYSRKTCTIVTTDRTYTDMAMESITLSKSTDSGSSREIPLSFRKVNVTEVAVTTYPGGYGKSGTTNAAAGSANTEYSETDETDDKEASWLKSVLAGGADLGNIVDVGISLYNAITGKSGGN